MTNGSLMKIKSIAECSKGEHSAILLTCIKRLLVLKTNFQSFWEWPFYTGFTANDLFTLCKSQQHSAGMHCPHLFAPSPWNVNMYYDTINSKIFARVLFSWNFTETKFRKNKTLANCCLPCPGHEFVTRQICRLKLLAKYNSRQNLRLCILE